MPAVNIAPYIRNQYFDANGVPLAGGLLHSKVAGTATLKNTYSDSEGTTANTNPVVLDSAGRAHIYLESGAYDFELQDSDGVTIWTEEGVSISSITTIVNTYADMKALVPGSYSVMRTLGRLSVNDGGGWWYYWDSDSTSEDDGGMVVQPASLPAAGRWIGFLPENRELNVRVYGAVCDGTTNDAAALTACIAYCNTNNCSILVDSSIYEATNVSFAKTGGGLVPLKLLPSAQFKYGNFQPSLNVVIDDDDRTRHFNCTISYIPKLSITRINAEWFGETWNSSHTITSAVYDDIVASNPYLHKFVTGYTQSKRIYTEEVTCSGPVEGASLDISGNAVVDGIFRTGTFTPTSTTPGDAGMIAWDANYIYVCVADATWKRVALSTY